MLLYINDSIFSSRRILFLQNIISTEYYFYRILFLQNIISTEYYFYRILFLQNIISTEYYFYLLLAIFLSAQRPYFETSVMLWSYDLCSMREAVLT